MIRRVIREAALDGYDESVLDLDNIEPEPATCLSDANLITSEVDLEHYPFFQNKDRRYHAPVLDLDIVAALIPSSTPGHSHWYLDKIIPEDKYFAFLDAAADAGILEQGYVDASKARGYTAVRLPWIEK